MERRNGPEFWLGLVASALVVIGTLIPWIMVSSPIKTDFSRGLPHHYWQLALLAGAVSFIAAARTRWAQVTALVCFVVVLGCLAGTVADILQFCGSLDGLVGCGSEGFLKVGPSPGLYLTGVAAVGGLGVHGYSIIRATPTTTTTQSVRSAPSETRPAAWHPDPTGRHEHRYWDGAAWTDHVSNAGVRATDPIGS